MMSRVDKLPPGTTHADLYRWQFGGAKAVHLHNLHFALAVMLRALARASDFVRGYNYVLGLEPEALVEGARTAALAHDVVQSEGLAACSSGLPRFDADQLFDAHTHASEDPQGAGADLVELKREFKGVFHNISAIVDCVPCQKCRLHFKVQLLGIGTALKWLLLPPALIPLATDREELVAVVNTLAKSTRAVSWAAKLAAGGSASLSGDESTAAGPAEGSAPAS
mmetsp:Transcript_3936/g.11401  ORF Transcript_3936/g.11401 Transcript_3936/m.11401 type:complete len:224 (+) Transcript_3936:1-672(+)